MTREERELSITYLEGIKEKYIEGEGYERHPLPEYYAIEMAIKALEQTNILDKLRSDIEDWYTDIHDNEYDAKDHDFVFEGIFEIIDEYRKAEE